MLILIMCLWTLSCFNFEKCQLHIIPSLPDGSLDSKSEAFLINTTDNSSGVPTLLLWWNTFINMHKNTHGVCLGIFTCTHTPRIKWQLRKFFGSLGEGWVLFISQLHCRAVTSSKPLDLLYPRTSTSSSYHKAVDISQPEPREKWGAQLP